MRDLHHPRYFQPRLYRSRLADRVGRFLYVLFAGTLLAALVAGIQSLKHS